MNIDLKRYKILDWGVLAVFVVAVIGISIPWWQVKMPSNVGGQLAGFGISLPSMNFNGWKSEVIGTGRLIFVLSLIAMLLIAGKGFFPAGTSLPSWYKASWAILGLGGLATLLGILGCLIPPKGGFTHWSWGLGSFITFVAAAALFGLGYLMRKDKTGAYDGQGQFKFPDIGGFSSPSGDK